MEQPIKPSVGRVVLFRGHPNDAGNGATEVPALIVRVLSDTCVNLMVTPDGPQPVWKTSVNYHQDDDMAGVSQVWRWMPYQLANPERAQVPAEEESPDPA